MPLYDFPFIIILMADSSYFSDFWEYDLEANEWMLVQENRGTSYWLYIIVGGFILTFGVGILLVAKSRKGK